MLDSVLDYCAREETRRALDPLLRRAREYVAGELGWVVRALQALGAVIALQTLLLLWLLWIAVRRQT